MGSDDPTQQPNGAVNPKIKSSESFAERTDEFTENKCNSSLVRGLGVINLGQTDSKKAKKIKRSDTKKEPNESRIDLPVVANVETISDQQQPSTSACPVQRVDQSLCMVKECLKTGQQPQRVRFLDELISELTCAICQEVCVDTVNLNCSHVFCECCIGEWLRNSNKCPVCRVLVTQQTRVLAVDNLLSKYFENQEDSISNKRNELLEERRRKKHAEQRRRRRLFRTQEALVTRRNIRLLHTGLANPDLAAQALMTTQGELTGEAFRLVLTRPETPEMSEQLGHQFQSALMPAGQSANESRNGRRAARRRPRVDLQLDYGLVDLAVELRSEQQLSSQQFNSQSVSDFLQRIGHMVDTFYRLESDMERMRRRNRIQQQRSRNDNEEARRERDQERHRRSQRLSRRDEITQFELNMD